MRVVISTWMAMAINTKHNAVYLCVLLTLSVQFKSLISVYMRANHTCAMEAVPALPRIKRRVLPRHSPTMHTRTTHYLDARTHCNAISATPDAVEYACQMRKSQCILPCMCFCCSRCTQGGYNCVTCSTWLAMATNTKQNAA